MIHGVASVSAEASGAVTSVRRDRMGIDFRASAPAKRMPKNGSQTTTACEKRTASVAVRFVAGGEDETGRKQDRRDPTEQQRQLRAHRTASTGVDQRRQ